MSWPISCPFGVLIITCGVGYPVAVHSMFICRPSFTKMYGSSGIIEATGGSCTSNVAIKLVEPASFKARHWYCPASARLTECNLRR